MQLLEETASEFTIRLEIKLGKISDLKITKINLSNDLKAHFSVSFGDKRKQN